MGDRQIPKAVAAVLISLFCLVLAGCAKNSNVGMLTGNVTLDGQPLKSGVIHFAATDGKTKTVDATISDGKYSVEMPAGDKKVAISAPKITGKRKMYETPDSPTVDVVQELLPAKYNVQTELTLTVNAGSQQKDFSLTTGK